MKAAVLIFLTGGVGLGGSVLSQEPAPTFRYSVTDLGTLPGGTNSMANAINAKGEVVGDAQRVVEHSSTDGFLQPFLWRGGKMTAIGPPALLHATKKCIPWVEAMDINDRGDVIETSGEYGPRFRVFLWSSGRVREITLIPGSTTNSAYGLNDRGQVVCSSTGKSYVYAGGHLTQVETVGGSDSSARAVNNAGDTVGCSTLPLMTSMKMYGGRMSTTPVLHAFLCRGGKMLDLGALPGLPRSEAVAVSDKGSVVGSAGPYNDDYVTTNSDHAFLWRDGQMTDLGTLGGPNSHASAINASDQVAGTTQMPSDPNAFISHAFLWENGVMHDLNGLIPSGTGWVLEDARGINDRGQIVGKGMHNGQERAFLLTPQ